MINLALGPQPITESTSGLYAYPPIGADRYAQRGFALTLGWIVLFCSCGTAAALHVPQGRAPVKIFTGRVCWDRPPATVSAGA